MRRNIASVRSPPSPISARGFLLGSALAHGLLFSLRFSYLWLDDVVRDQAGTFLPRLIEEGSGALGAALLSWWIFVAWRAAPLRGSRFWRRAPGFLALGVVLSAANTSFMWGSRLLLFPLAGLGPYDYGRMPLRYLMELPGALIYFAMVVCSLALAEEMVFRREQAVTQSELERALAESQLRSLRLQLQPHFLFNALNTISAQLHEDPHVADHLVGRLSELLRASLRSTDGSAVLLRDELALLEAYADLMRARFGSRLCLAVEADTSLLDTLVPSLLLQPLVENAVRHGNLEREGTARVSVHIRRERDHLVLRVADDGPGVATGFDPLTAGTGLSTTARRLALLHGSAASVRAANAPEGGFAVTIELPVGR